LKSTISNGKINSETVKSTNVRSNINLCTKSLIIRKKILRAAANGLKLKPIKSQVIVISRCRVDISPRTLPIGSDVIKVVPMVNNLAFFLNERLMVTDNFK
jgi:hypothetical protein